MPPSYFQCIQILVGPLWLCVRVYFLQHGKHCCCFFVRPCYSSTKFHGNLASSFSILLTTQHTNTPTRRLEFGSIIVFLRGHSCGLMDWGLFLWEKAGEQLSIKMMTYREKEEGWKWNEGLQREEDWQPVQEGDTAERDWASLCHLSSMSRPSASDETLMHMSPDRHVTRFPTQPSRSIRSQLSVIFISVTTSRSLFPSSAAFIALICSSL